MSLTPNLEEQEALAETLARLKARMPAEERRREALIGVAFVLAVVALWIEAPPGDFDLLPAALCLLVLAVASRVRFDTPFGFTVATQLAFVPWSSLCPRHLFPPLS